jgi:hypothetical protein
MRTAIVLLLLATLPAQSPPPAKAPTRLCFAVVGGGPFLAPAASVRLQQAIDGCNALAPDLVVGLAPPAGPADAAAPPAWTNLRAPFAPPPPTPLPADVASALAGPHGRAVVRDGCWFVHVAAPTGDAACRAWLGEALAAAAGAPAVFVFTPDAPWLDATSPAWQATRQDCHRLLAAAGNVRAVFGVGGSVRHDGVRDGIAYHAVPPLGAEFELDAPDAGYAHAVHFVQVRGTQVRVAAIALGAARDGALATGAAADGALRVATGFAVELDHATADGAGDAVGLDGRVAARATLRCRNPADHPSDVELTPQSEAGWAFEPDHQHVVVPAGGTATTTFVVHRAADPAQPFALPQLLARPELLVDGRRVAIGPIAFWLPLPPPAALGRAHAETNGALALDGEGAGLRVPASQVALPADACTVELWACGDGAPGRQTLAQLGEAPQCALVVDGTRVAFAVALANGFATAAGPADTLQAGRWRHLAGVHDGAEVRLYVDGALAARAPARGPRRADVGPLLVGLGSDAQGRLLDAFAGRIDDVRLGRSARYAADFAPPTRPQPDADTVLLLPCDVDFGPWTADRSGHGRHARRLGTAHCTRVQR